LKYTGRFLILLFLMTVAKGSVLWAQPFKQSPEAIGAVQKALMGLSHVKTLKTDVVLVKTAQGKTSTLNYTLYADMKGNAAAVLKGKRKTAFVQNKKGLYFIRNGEVMRQSRQKDFPFDVPFTFLNQLKMGDVTDNYKFVVHEKLDKWWVVDMIPLGGGTIEQRQGKEAVTQLRLTLALPHYFLVKVEIFKNNALKTNDVIELSYAKVENKILLKKGLFRNQYSESEEWMLVGSKSVADVGKTAKGLPDLQIKQIRYSNMTINGPLDEAIFDEENY